MTFQTHGHPGKWIHSEAITGLYEATGSIRVGGLITSGSTTGTVTLSDGGVIQLSALASGVVHELSVGSVNVSAGGVYLLVKRHNAI